MRYALPFAVGLCAALLAGSADAKTSAVGEVSLPLRSPANSCTGPLEKGGAPREIARGQQLGIACSAAGRQGVAVSVVMQFDPESGETATGYQAFLVTEQTVESGMVHVRIPDMPDLANHTVDVKVYVTDETGTSSCDAGRIKVV
jgi:hypothetical protein